METSTDLANGIYLRGILKKKKLKHGMFEDPYKTKVECWILSSTLCIKPIDVRSPAAAGVEELDVAVWEVCSFSLGPHCPHLKNRCANRLGNSRQMVNSQSLTRQADSKNSKQAPGRLQRNGSRKYPQLRLGYVFLEQYDSIFQR